MARKYNINLVHTNREKQYTEIRRDVPVIIKPISDFDIKGAMDPRLYQSSKKISLIMRFLPKSLMKMDMSPKSISRLRKMFNGVDYTQIVEETIEEFQFTIKAEDGFNIPMTRFSSQKQSSSLFYSRRRLFCW